MSQPFLRLRRCSCCPHPDSMPCVPSAVKPHLSSLALGSPAWPGYPLHLHPRGPALCVRGLPSPCTVSVSPSPCLCSSVSVFVYLSLSLSLSLCLSVCPSLSPSVSLTFCLSVSHHLSVCPSVYVPLSVCLPLYLSLSLLIGCSSVFLVFYFRITKSHPTKSQTNE